MSVKIITYLDNHLKNKQCHPENKKEIKMSRETKKKDIEELFNSYEKKYKKLSYYKI